MSLTTACAKSRDMRRTAGLVLGGLSLAELGVSAGTEIAAFVLDGKVSRECPGHYCQRDVKVSAAATLALARQMSGAVRVALAAGLAGLGGAATLLILSDRSAGKWTGRTSLGVMVGPATISVIGEL